MVKLPMRVASGLPLRPLGAGDSDGGWSVMDCNDLNEALAVMARYPAARLPCWSRIELRGKEIEGVKSVT